MADAWGGIRVISPGYFEIMGIRLLEGRTFTEHDTEGAPRVGLVNQAMARKVLAAGPIGPPIPAG